MVAKDKRIALALGQLEYDVNFNRDIIYLEGEIDTYSAPFFMERVNAIRDLREKTVGGEEKDISLYITSPGGDIAGLLAIIDIMDNLPLKINTFGLGLVASAAVWLLAAGTGKRYIAPNTEVMIHEISSWFKGTTTDVENEAKQIKAIQQNLYRLLGKYSKKDASYWAKKIKGQNLFLTSSEIIELGLVDEFIPSGIL